MHAKMLNVDQRISNEKSSRGLTFSGMNTAKQRERGSAMQGCKQDVRYEEERVVIAVGRDGASIIVECQNSP